VNKAAADTGFEKTTKPKPADKTPSRKRLLFGIDRIGQALSNIGVSFTSVRILHCDAPPDLSGRETDPSLIFEELNLRDISQLTDYRDESLIRARLKKGYICRVAKNQEGIIENVRWCTNHPYYCWPIRMMIDPGPRGWYGFDAFTMPHARRRRRLSQHFTAWYNMLPPGAGPMVSIVSSWNNAAFNAFRKLGFVETCRVCCIVVFGYKLVRVRWISPEPAVQWFARSWGKTLAYDACELRIY